MVPAGSCGGAHIVLTGPMGSGKTTVGLLLAARLGRPFLDSDAQIEAEYGVSSRQLAVDRGVDWLHRAEAEELRRALRQGTPSVVAAAASVGDRQEVARWLGGAVVSVLLVGDTDVLAARAAGGRHRRPLGMAQYRTSAGRRKRLLRRHVDLVLDVTRVSAEEVVDAIIAHCRKRSAPAQDAQAQRAD